MIEKYCAFCGRERVDLIFDENKYFCDYICSEAYNQIPRKAHMHWI